jgi:hypothetical protein
MMARTRAEQDAKEPLFYQAHFDKNGQPLEPPLIYDYNTGLLISESNADKFPQPQPYDETGVPASLPAPGESIDDSLMPNNPDDIITVEIG